MFSGKRLELIEIFAMALFDAEVRGSHIKTVCHTRSLEISLAWK
jgi:hypothetical protein